MARTRKKGNPFVFFVVFFVAIKSSPDTTNMYDICYLIRSVLKLYYTLNRFLPQVFYRTDVYLFINPLSF